jgi:hypothetical protein
MKNIDDIPLTDQIKSEREPTLLVTEINARLAAISENFATLYQGDRLSAKTVEGATIPRNPFNFTSGIVNVYDFLDPLWARLRLAQLKVTEAMMAQNSVGQTQLQTDSVTTRALLADSVTADKIYVNTLSAIIANLGTITAGNITLDTAGFIRGGQTGYNTGIGFWAGYDTSAYKLSIGNPAGNYLRWTGSALEISGSLTATTGTIGGWTIAATTISANNATLNSTGQLTLGTSNDIVYLSAIDSTYRLWVGNVTAASAAFSVTKAGALYATSGTIGGWTLGATTISASNIALNNTGTIIAGTSDDVICISAADSTYRVWIGNAAAASATFKVTKAGVLTATGATISGILTATSGAIGGWTLGSTSLTSGSGSNTVGVDSGGTNPAFYAGSATPASAPFRVTQAGVFTCTSGTFSGTVDVGTSTSRTLIDTNGVSIGNTTYGSINFLPNGFFPRMQIQYNGTSYIEFNTYFSSPDYFGTLTISRTGLSGDTNTVIGCNSIIWGSDTNIYRSAANSLKTDDSFEVALNLKANGVIIGKGMTTVKTLTGGSTEESFNLDISGQGFTAKPNSGLINCSSDKSYHARYDFDDGSNSSTNAVVKVSRYDGTNVGAGGVRFSCIFFQ